MNGLGFTLGFAIGFVLIAIIIRICNKNNKSKTEYDERQLLTRGKAYKYSYVAVIICLALMMIFEANDIKLPIDRITLCFIPIIISALINVIYCIIQDAYFGLNNEKKKYGIAFSIIAIINLAFAIMSIVDGQMIVDGILTYKSLNLICAFMFILIAVTLLIKAMNTNRNGGDEDEES